MIEALVRGLSICGGDSARCSRFTLKVGPCKRDLVAVRRTRTLCMAVASYMLCRESMSIIRSQSSPALPNSFEASAQ
jgi:hypothetical protein